MNYNLSNIKKAKYYLDKNECIGFPTETVYGLAANAYSKKAALKIFKLKKRNKRNPLIVHYCSLKMLNNDCMINEEFLKLYKKYCPGPVTFVLKLKKNSNISKIVTNNKKTLAVRFPRHHLAIKLLKILKYPLAAPSANISSKISPVTKEDVKDEFGERIKFATDILTAELKILENYFQKYEILVDIMKLKGGFTEMFDLKTLRTKSIL